VPYSLAHQSRRAFGGFRCGLWAWSWKSHDCHWSATIPHRHVHIRQRRRGCFAFSRSWIRIFTCLFVGVVAASRGQSRKNSRLSWKPHLRPRIVNGSNVCHEPDAVAIILFDYDWWLATDNLSIHTHTPLWYDGAVTLVFPPRQEERQKGMKSRPFFPCGHEIRVVSAVRVFKCRRILI
jgi:hypothetical protein